MNIDYYINQLRCNRDILLSLYKSIDPVMVQWSQDQNSWSPLHIVCHMVDEEKYDFRYRALHILEQPDKLLPSIDPLSWIIDNSYNEQDYYDKIKEFQQERNISIGLLSQLKSSDDRWNNTYEHSHFGVINSEYYLKNWLAHDLLHIKQMTRLRYDFLSIQDDIPVEYAGTWT